MLCKFEKENRNLLLNKRLRFLRAGWTGLNGLESKIFHFY